MPIKIDTSGLVLSELLERFDEVIEDGEGSYRVQCPSHDDSDPSLVLTLKKDGKLLVKCRAGCETKDVLKKLGLSFSDLHNVVPGEGISARTNEPEGPTQNEYDELEKYVAAAAVRLHGDSSGAEEALAYLYERFGVTPELATKLRLGVDDGYLGEWDKLPSVYTEHTRLVVPFLDPSGTPRYLQGRDLSHRSPVRWCGPKGSGWARLAFMRSGSGWDTIVVTEGPGDALSVVAAGWDAIAVRGAALSSGSVVDAIVSASRDHKVVIAGDNDNAGMSFRKSLGEALHDKGITAYALTLPDSINDLTEWRESDPNAFADNLARALRSATAIIETTTVTRKKPGDGLPLTDLGNAERLKRRLGGVRYVPEMGFFLCSGGTWEFDKYDLVRQNAHNVTYALIELGESMTVRTTDETGAMTLTQSPEGKKVQAHGERSQSSRQIDTMVKELAVMPGVPIDADSMDGKHDKLAFRNGVVDLRTGKLLPHDPSLLLTKCLPYDFDPDAECPRWDRFLSEIFPTDPDLPPYMQRLIGYGITGDTAEQCFAILWGTGANGKSVLTDTLTEVFRPITVTTPFSTFEEKPNGGIPNDIASLKGARLVMASEGSQGKPMAEAVIKRITGRDSISARFMRKEFFEFHPTFLILLATNHRPAFRGQDEGLWRRVKLIPFARFFAPDERDHMLGDHLLAERQGIAAWAVRGAVQWYATGLMDPASVRQATSDYKGTSDRLDGFLPGVYEFDPNGSVSGPQLYRDYQTWCDHEELPDKERWSRNAVYASLEERGCTLKRDNKGKQIQGVSKVGVAREPIETPSTSTPGSTSLTNIFGG